MAEEKKGLFKPSRLGFYLFSLIVFYFAIHYIGKLKDIQKLLLEMKPVWLLVVLAAQTTTYLLNSLILRTLLAGKTGTTGFITLLKISVVIMFVNQALPSGGLSGNGYIFNQLVKRKIPSAQAFIVLVFESICYYFAFLILLGISYLWYAIRQIHVVSVIKYTVLTGFIFFILLGIIILLTSNKRTIKFILHKLHRFGYIRRYIMKNNLLSIQDKSATGWHYFITHKKAFLLAVLLQICILFSDVITVIAIMNAFHVSLPFSNILLGLLLAQVIGSLPISPGSLIAYESAMTYFYTIMGAQVHVALIVTLLYRFFTFWLPIPVGLLLYRNLQHENNTHLNKSAS
ncbi:flippase-like domain-containing protein [Chitinophaga oryziterrae]|uniref:Flippase-like domain-containing protein n=1 Tax=Chitinophaga oryziterrae TaxID=1031224 RepID=A0A6N8JB56_9BACT|nr:lysylphosphatidylglycerol synthase transmembrane domain-containing protein [Chitinophaga oryziterrae]MVT42393.1 flippase-like domain-containing protein [Chitinophaga oryziterrae]